MRTLAAAALVVLLAPASAAAHRIEVDARMLPDGRFHVEVFYSDGKPARKAEIIVRDLSGNEVARGAADADGVFEFLAPLGVELEVEARHEGGHRAVKKIKSREAEKGSSESGKRGRIPYGKLAVGVVLIVALALFVRWALRNRHAP
jgi:uncharacterized GH25 family protein